jgi:F0F1-type ATP synthase assembly protein I
MNSTCRLEVSSTPYFLIVIILILILILILIVITSVLGMEQDNNWLVVSTPLKNISQFG